ncbi:MAG: hypothetical protein AAGG48_13525 [Planctomycetota bacterium]
MSMTNPYEPPIDASPTDLTRKPSLPGHLNAMQRKWMTRAFRWMRVGSWALLATVLMVLIQIFAAPITSIALLKSLVAIVCFSVSAVMVGLIIGGWAVPFRPRMLPRIALVTLLMGATFSAFYFFNVLEHGITNGLIQLFGGTSFALLLSGLAFVSLFIRKNLNAESRSWRHACDLSVIAYAIAAFGYSSFTLYPSLGFVWQIVIPCLASTTAVALQTFAINAAATTWNQSMRDPSVSASV